MDYKKLILEALKYRERAYAPYSKFKVGAAVIMEDGKIYSGCNIENASYGATNCAERTAIFKAVSEGGKTIKAIAIVGDLHNYTYPCGICRQVIEEFSDYSTDIVLAKNENDYIVKNFGEILPGAFSKKDLN
ncbi:cytidine deaminase [Clostridium pasteurianum]|uniref:Cytidine deaminase n=1 Tax=Clostridium pasteurianum BC1 TaxID=86416 RepID=R4K994_CLOPA|nr:cytidine deaminase [Clostridium pasteurianum]AGK97084.1 cytidine deaminase, homotetrameric [Clostridium pasteurianum BC1]